MMAGPALGAVAAAGAAALAVFPIPDQLSHHDCEQAQNQQANDYRRQIHQNISLYAQKYVPFPKKDYLTAAAATEEMVRWFSSYWFFRTSI